MSIEQAIEWLCNHCGKIEFKRPRHNVNELLITARYKTIGCCWMDMEQNMSQDSIPIEKIIELIEQLDYNIGNKRYSE